MINKKELRQKVAYDYSNGLTLTQIVHPLTKIDTPESLLPTHEEFIQSLKEGTLFEGLESIQGKVAYDIAFKGMVFDAFGINNKLGNANKLLIEAISEYNKENQDSYELVNSLVGTTLESLRSDNVSAIDIENSFSRTAALKGVVTLEGLALSLCISFTKETSNMELSELIKDKL